MGQGGYRITYSSHALQRMRKRRVSPEDVELTVRIGAGQFDEEDRTWTYELDRLAVVIVDRDGDAHIVTVMRKRKHT